jgi:uncharacterized tellurite resistance protein B-like protein
MVKNLKQFFDKFIRPSSGSSGDISPHTFELATAALLIEVTRADIQVNKEERASPCAPQREAFCDDRSESPITWSVAHSFFPAVPSFFMIRFERAISPGL